MCNYFIYNLVVKLIDSFMIRIHIVTFYLCTFGFFCTEVDYADSCLPL